MISGILGISIAFVAATVGAAAYWLYYRDKNVKLLTIANGAFTIQGVSILFAVFLLYSQIFAHNFQLNYVYSYSSFKLSTYYLISTFWAGQEGTFLLWLFFGTLFGIILIRTVTRKQPMVMFFLMLVQSFLLLILLKKSPFAMIWQVHSNVPAGFMPADGASLNPLLQNPWMIIHPPIMFMGYSSTVVAFAFTMNAMVTKKLQDWVKLARPWIIFSTLMLGTGIILGGYWSYVTLGWGGYWAWDPVENASFVPWVISAALLHGVIIQIRQKGLVKTNLFLAGLSFISVLWGSFLTRSGVLADFSVHSFGESDMNIYLMSLVGFFSAMFLYLYFKTIRKTESNKFAEGLFSRETFILIGSLTLLFTGIIVFVGTSAPIYTGLFGKASNVSINFYHTISVPIAVFLLFAMALAPILAWKVSGLNNPKVLGIGATVALTITILGIILGMDNLISILLVYLSILAVLINGYVGYQFIRKIPGKVGGYLAHIGIALMVIGIVFSSMYDSSEKVSVPMGEFVDTDFGYKVEFTDFTKSPDGKDRVNFLVQKDGRSFKASPQFYFSEYTKSYMLSPHVNMSFDKDIYISPISYIPAKNNDSKQIQLLKNNSTTIDGVKIAFTKFITGQHADGSTMTVKADLTVSVNRNDNEKQYSVQPAMWMEDGKIRSDEVEIPETNHKIRLEHVDANSGSVTLLVSSPSAALGKSKPMMAVEISEKPFISILWIGTLIMILGVAMALYDRIRTQQK